MHHLTLKRITSKKDVTLGVLLDTEGYPICMTLERPWVDNKTDISCIPEQTYSLVPYTSKKYPNVFHLKGVPARSKILIHVGNRVDHTKGCILVGRKYGFLKGKRAVLNSRSALQDLKAIIGTEECLLTIV